MKTLRWVLTALAAVVLFVAVAGVNKVTCIPAPPEEPVCAAASDCEGLPHILCVGEWTCVQGLCSWECAPKCNATAETCGDALDNDCDGLVDEGCCLADADCLPGQICEILGPCAMCDCPPGMDCPMCECWGQCVDAPQPPAKCYTDAECPAGQYCKITNDCCPPPGCGPGDICIQMCFECGECATAQGQECTNDADCPPGFICEEQAECPPCVNNDPPCMAPCWMKQVCVPGCQKINPFGYGMCAMFMGYGFDGTKCMGVSGCGCGNDCGKLFNSLEECKKACLNTATPQ